LATINVVAIASPHYRREASPLMKKGQSCGLICLYVLYTIEECLEYCNSICVVDSTEYASCCFTSTD
ncbi:7032_t:CDS:2, partial [Dentiscutata heterogama]